MQAYYCQKCEHYISNGKCKAFPDRIPPEIILGEKKHETKLDNQVGDYIFKKKYIDISQYKIKQ